MLVNAAGGGAEAHPPPIMQPVAVGEIPGPPAVLETAITLRNYWKAQKATRVYCLKQFLSPELQQATGKKGSSMLGKDSCMTTYSL